MNAQEFNDLLDDTLDRIREGLRSKGEEYVPADELSRFHNFETAAAFNRSSSEEELWGFVTKHLVSLADMVKGEATAHSLAVWDEKIGDSLNYFTLLRGIVHEKHAKDAEAEFHTNLVNSFLPEDTNVKSVTLEDPSRVIQHTQLIQPTS